MLILEAVYEFVCYGAAALSGEIITLPQDV